MQNVRKISFEKWVEMLPEYDQVFFSHTPIWYELWADIYNSNFGAFHFEFKNGKTALFPYLIQKRKGFYRTLVSSPGNTFGGFLVNDALSYGESLEVKEFLNSKSSFSILDRNPNKYIYKGFRTFRESTFSLSLNDIKDVTNFSTGHQANINRASGKMEVKLAESYSDWEEYYNVYLMNFSNWIKKKVSTISFKLFEKLSFVSNQYCKLWLLRQNDVCVGGAICLYYGQNIQLWHDALLSHHNYIGGNHLLQKEIIDDAKIMGYSNYDLGSARKIRTQRRFRRGFGAEEKILVSVRKNGVRLRTRGV